MKVNTGWIVEYEYLEFFTRVWQVNPITKERQLMMTLSSIR